MTNNKTNKESWHQAQYVEWATYKGIAHFLIVSVSAGSRLKISGAHLKAQGWQKGIPDIFLAIPNKTYHGLFIELKRSKEFSSKVSKEQKLMLDRLQSVGYFAIVAYGHRSAEEITERYLEGYL